MTPLNAIAQPIQRDSKLCDKIGVASEHAYTKEDALRNQYNRQFDIHATIEDIVSGKFDTSNIRLPSFKPEDIEAYRQKLEANGLGKDIDWQGISFDFSTVDIELDTADQVSSKVDYISSRYAVLKERIGTEYAGNELKSQMEKLDKIFFDAKELLSNSYAKVVGGFLEQNGISNETDKLKESVKQNIDNRADQYLSQIKNKGNYVELNDSEKWLLRDDAFMAAQLRESMAETSSISIPPAYSLRDLEIVGMYVQQTSEQFASLESTGFIRNEESIGLDLAVQAMKTDYLAKNSGVSDDMSSLLNRAFNEYMKNYLEKIDQSLSKDANHTVISGSKQLYASLDKSAVYDVYQYTMKQYSATSDMANSLISGAQYGKSLFNQKVDSKDYGTMARYQSKALYKWDNFFQNNGKNPYDANMSDLDKYSIALNHFIGSVKSSSVQDIDMMLGLNGNSSASRITYLNSSQYTRSSNLHVYA
jgi:hypothetical protein